MSDYRLEGLWFHVHVFVKLRKEEKSIAEKLKLVIFSIGRGQIPQNIHTHKFELVKAKLV